jgi:hypothetical protein
MLRSGRERGKRKISDCAVVEDERDEAESRAQAFENSLAEAVEALRQAYLEIAKLNCRLLERKKKVVSRTVRAKKNAKSDGPSTKAEHAE